MRLQRALLRSSELLLASRSGPDGRHDESLTIGRNVELGFGSDPEKLEDGLIDDDAGAVPHSLQALRHSSFITPFITCGNPGTGEGTQRDRSAQRTGVQLRAPERRRSRRD